MDLHTILTAIAGFIVAVYAGIKKLKKPKDAAIEAEGDSSVETTGSDVFDALTAQADIYSELNVALKETNADRILLLHVNNGGDRVLHSGARLYLTAFAEVYDDALPVRNSYQARELHDPHYIGMLRDLARDRTATLIAADLHADMGLKAAYERSGIKEAHVHLAHTEPGRVWYVSAGFKGDPAQYSEAILADCAAKVGSLLKRPMFHG